MIFVQRFNCSAMESFHVKWISMNGECFLGLHRLEIKVHRSFGGQNGSEQLVVPIND